MRGRSEGRNEAKENVSNVKRNKDHHIIFVGGGR